MRLAILFATVLLSALAPFIRAEESPAAPELNKTFVAPLLEAAEKYSDWQMVDSHRRMAPLPCASGFEKNTFFSKSKDTTTHGKKQYFLYAKMLEAYEGRTELQPVGQALVKQSWVPSTADSPVYDKQGDLFVMLKLDPKTAGTDKGWVYATLTPDGKNVTSAGRVASCMKCHEDAKHDRLFGLPKVPADKK